MMLSIILLTAFISISLLDYFSARDSLEEEIISSSMPLLRESIYSSILHDLLPAIHASSVMANDNFLVDWSRASEEDADSVARYLDQIVDEFGFLTAFVISDKSGRYYHPGGIHKTIDPSDSHDVWYYSFVASGVDFDLDVDTNEAAEDLLTIFANSRLEDRQGNLLGVTGVGLEMRGFSSFLAEQQNQFSRQIYLVDEKGIIQAHSDMSLIESGSIYELEGLKEIADDLLVESDQPYSGRYGKSGDRTIITSRYIPEISWFIIVEHSENAVLAAAREHLLQSLIIGFFAFALVLVLTLMTLRGYDRSLQSMAITDSLTGIANRRALEVALPRMLYRKKRADSVLSLIIIDIDGFKLLNDNHGHQTGDSVLVSFASCAEEAIRPDDLLVRWGGDEFVIVTESSIDEATSLANEIKRAFDNVEKRVTLSIGLSEAGQNESPESLLKNADIAMYKAKERGRDQVVVFERDK